MRNRPSIGRSNPANCLLVLLALILSLALSGCLRYTASRADQIEKASSDKTIRLAPEKILEQEVEKRARLAQFVDSRKNLLLTGQQGTYSIGPGDVISMSVFDLPELDVETPVRPDGRISLNILNDVEIGGLTVSEAQNKLTSLLSPYVVNPKVRLSIKDYQSQKVSVIGAVAKPGSYELLENLVTVTEILSEAGGRTDKAGSRIIIIPTSKPMGIVAAPPAAKAMLADSDALAGEQGIELFMDDLTGESGSTPMIVPLQHGDTLVVPEAGEVQVVGDVKRPGSYPLTGKMSILGAIAAAGGLEYSANANKVELVRDLSQEQKALAIVDLEKVALEKSSNFRLQDGDVVQVPSSGGRFAGRQVVEFINGMFNVGVQASN